MPPPSKRQKTGAQASILGFVTSSKAETFFYADGTATWAIGSPPAAVDSTRQWSATVKLRAPFNRTLTLATTVSAAPALFYKESSAYDMNSISLLKSHLQKAVRRMDARRAMASTLEILRLCPDELLRRLPIIVLEDVGPASWLPGMIWLMCAHSKGYKLRDSDVAFLLGAVQQLCECGTKALRVDHCTVTTPSEVPLPCEATTVQLSLLLRALYGGMDGDVQMCYAYGSNQFATLPLPELATQPSRVDPSEVQALHADDWIFEAVDFHCSSICKELRLRLSGDLASITEDELKNWMWSTRAGVNVRRSPDGSVAITPVDPPWAKITGAHLTCDGIARDIVVARTIKAPRGGA